MQYPVFPWVINVYEGNHLDLNDVNTYRKLNKPIACQKPENEEKYKMHYAVSQRKTDTNILIHIRFVFLLAWFDGHLYKNVTLVWLPFATFIIDTVISYAMLIWSNADILIHIKVKECTACAIRCIVSVVSIQFISRILKSKSLHIEILLWWSRFRFRFLGLRV